MKRTYLAKRNALLTARSVSWGALALTLVLVFFLLRLIAPNFFWQLASPFFRMSDTVAAESHVFFSRFGDVAALTAENEFLADSNATLAIENQALLKKIDGLTALVGDAQKNLSGIVVPVIARPPESPYDTLVLAAGKNEGVTVGMQVFGASGAPVGSVSSVLDSFSRVTLLTAPGLATNGWVGRENIPITIMGLGGGTLTATIARAARVQEGDVVFVPGPEQLPIGRVVRLEDNSLLSSVTLRIMPATNLFQTTWVVLRETHVAPSAFATSTILL